MMASRGMGAISPTKMPGGKKKARRDDTDFTQYAEGGEVKNVTKSLKDAGFYEAGKDKSKRLNIINKVTTKPQRMEIVDKIFSAKKMAAGGETKSKVNEAGNYTKPGLRKRIFNSVKAAAMVGTGAGQWSARKAQVMAKRYKAAGGGYRD
jgi:hypothetical protein